MLKFTIAAACAVLFSAVTIEARAQTSQGAKRYDAVVVDKTRTHVAHCYNWTTQKSAKDCALAKCTQAGGIACTVNSFGEGKGGYGAVAAGASAGGVYAIWGYKTEAGATGMALQGCSADSQNCHIIDTWYEGRPGVYEDGQ